MALTSIEYAKGLWCPFARVTYEENERHGKISVHNRLVTNYGINYTGTECISWKCAMWEWTGKHDEKNNQLGYCGLTHKKET